MIYIADCIVRNCKLRRYTLLAAICDVTHNYAGSISPGCPVRYSYLTPFRGWNMPEGKFPGPGLSLPFPRIGKHVGATTSLRHDRTISYEGSRFSSETICKWLQFHVALFDSRQMYLRNLLLKTIATKSGNCNPHMVQHAAFKTTN